MFSVSPYYLLSYPFYKTTNRLNISEHENLPEQSLLQLEAGAQFNIFIILWTISNPRPLPWFVYILRTFLPALQWWWRPILWDLEYLYCWISLLLNQNTITPRIIHNCNFLPLLSILYLLFRVARRTKIIHFIPINITVTAQSLILLFLDVIDVEVFLVLYILESILQKIFIVRIF